MLLPVTWRYRNLDRMKPTDDRATIRVNLSLPLDLVSILDRIGAVTGAGRATLIRELLIESKPILLDLARASELAQEKNLDAFKVLSASLDAAASQAQQMSLDIKKTRRRAMRRQFVP